MYLRLLVSSIFLILTLTSTVANANCVVDGTGAIVTPANIRTAPTPGLAVNNGSNATSSCTITPTATKFTIFKIALCTADTSSNDLSSCQYILDSAAGIEHILKQGLSSALATPGFGVAPGSYDYLAFVLSSKYGTLASWRTTNDVWSRCSDYGSAQAEADLDDGNCQSWTKGTYCWTDHPGPTTYNPSTTLSLAHGQAVSGSKMLIACGSSPGTAKWTYELTNILQDHNGSDQCYDGSDRSTFLANGDRFAFTAGDADGVNYNIISNLLQSDDTFATTCENTAKVLFTAILPNPVVVTANSLFDLKFKQEEISHLEFGGSDRDWNDPEYTYEGPPWMYKVGISPPQLYLTTSEPAVVPEEAF
ncbi:hypothetical protein N9Q65_01210 [Candidatus Thioglobus sp.]|nr:hypothetical protein [Candidatus Thioglobus sp.]